MSLLYQCIICEHTNKSVSDLHGHHMHDHTLQELSRALIDLRGFKIWSDTTVPKQPPESSPQLDVRPVGRPSDSGDTNNNENLYNGLIPRPRVSSNSNYKKQKQVINWPRENEHDEMKCAIDCSPFIPWERELNKREEINHDEFLDSVESLCYDLGRRKRRGRKRKVKVETVKSNENDKNLMEYIENVIGVKPEVVEQPMIKIEPYEEETSSLENNENSANVDANISPTRTKKEDTIRSVENTTVLAETNAADNSILPTTQTMKIVKDVRNDEIKTERDKNILNDKPMCNIFSWNTIITVHADERDTFTEGKNSYYELMVPDVETFL